MFKETIPGLDKVLVSDIPKGAVIIVTGTAGSLKSAFVYNMMSQYLKKSKGEKGIYVTLEESKQSHMRNMKSLGINIEKNLKVSDLASFRAHIGFEQMDYLDLIMKRTTGSIKALSDPTAEKIDDDNSNTRGTSSKVTCFALDSLNALYALIDVDKPKMRNKLLEFFTFLRQNQLTSFIVLELAETLKYSEEFFLADGIIEFGITSSSQKTLKRYIQIRKLRASKHSLDPFVIEVWKNGLKVVGKLL
jgi:KaiC/GvpD/RAD55 family RecA-like ATPase